MLSCMLQVFIMITESGDECGGNPMEKTVSKTPIALGCVWPNTS